MLTPREKQAAGLIARGLSEKAAAQAMGVRYDTVRDYVSTAARRIGGEGSPRHRLTLWFLSLVEEES